MAGLIIHACVLAIVVFCIHDCAGHLEGDGVIRDTTLGQVLGSMSPPLVGISPVEKFHGIPFAKPPTGELRFEEPEVMMPWDGVLPTLHLHPACPQMDGYLSYITEHRVGFNKTDEDCLYLNVFVPVVENGTVVKESNITGVPKGTVYGHITNKPLAVLVFIHGGSNIVGTANMFDGDILASVGEIIVVTVNYRLAALGFLGDGSPGFPGNYGLLDMIAALRWVKLNIASFNGDPNQVTVMGHSAGAMDVGVLLVSPLAKGLFRTVISQSGPVTSIIATRWPGHNSTREILDLGQLMGCVETTLVGVKKCLKTIDVVKLSKDYRIYDGYQFPAVVGDNVLPKMPEELLREGELNADTFLIGTTRDEAGKWSYLSWHGYILKLMSRCHVLPGAIHFKDLVRFEYRDFAVPLNDTTDVRIDSMAYGDAVMDAPTVDTLQILSKRNISLFQYRWEWRSALSPLPEVTGVPHGADLFYLFGAPLRGHQLYNYTTQDNRMSSIMMRQWSHFVKFSTFEVNRLEWPIKPAVDQLPYTKDTRAYTRFYDNNGVPAIGLGYNLKEREAVFWNSVIPDMFDEISRKLEGNDNRRNRQTHEE